MRRSRNLVLSLAVVAGMMTTFTPTRNADAAICPRIFLPVCAVKPTGARETAALPELAIHIADFDGMSFGAGFKGLGHAALARFQSGGSRQR